MFFSHLPSYWEPRLAESGPRLFLFGWLSQTASLQLLGVFLEHQKALRWAGQAGWEEGKHLSRGSSKTEEILGLLCRGAAMKVTIEPAGPRGWHRWWTEPLSSVSKGMWHLSPRRAGCCCADSLFNTHHLRCTEIPEWHRCSLRPGQLFSSLISVPPSSLLLFLFAFPP